MNSLNAIYFQIHLQPTVTPQSQQQQAQNVQMAQPQQQVVVVRQVPQPQPNIRYVDQYGNPVPAPQPVIKYVDQYGNPVAPPVGGVQSGYAAPSHQVPQTTTSPNVKFNNANARKQAALKNASAAKCERIAAMILGIIALILISVGFGLNSLAYDSNYDSGGYSDIHCGFTEVRIECDSSYYSSFCTELSYSYDDFCTAQDIACGTQRAASACLAFMIISLVCILVGIILVNPCCDITPCCCRTSKQWTCSRFLFIIGLLLSILAIVIWMAGDDWCMESGDLGIGSTIIVLGISCVFSLIAICFARR